jgi:hypothetical protein
MHGMSSADWNCLIFVSAKIDLIRFVFDEGNKDLSNYRIYPVIGSPVADELKYFLD